MKDFQLRNDTKLLFRSDPTQALTELTASKRVLFVYGNGSVRKNGCYDDVKKAVENGGGILYEHGNASRELTHIEKGIRLVEENKIELVIGAGGANIMDCAKLIAFGAYHTEHLWEYVKGKKNPYGLKKLPLILMPTYPSSGSEYGLGAVAADSRTGDFGTAYGIAADTPDGNDAGSETAAENNTEGGTSAGESKGAAQSDGSNILIAYFSVMETDGVDTVGGASRVAVDGEVLGNNEYVAQLIQQETGGDLFAIETVQDYPTIHDPLLEFAYNEKAENARPELASQIENLDQYDVIFLGFPNWNADLPMPLYTFLEEYDFSGKTIIPFTTHGG
ncbi:MAG: flavodoxin, partial [Lachnospiraceae bacterium]|nr:flavodoxin [Lachnospiraceae bacterium]